MWINRVNVKYKKPKKDIGVVPYLVQLRVIIGFIIAILSVIIDYHDLLSQSLTLVPYVTFTICMILFYKKRIGFRLWFINSVILGIGVQCYLASPQLVTIFIDTVLIIAIYVSPYIKEHYKKKGYVETDISDV